MVYSTGVTDHTSRATPPAGDATARHWPGHCREEGMMEIKEVAL
jgi:hypothetical protein